MAKTETVQAAGKSYVVRKLTPGDHIRVMQMGIPAADEAQFGYSTLFYSIDAVDGTPVPRPKTKDDLAAVGDLIDPEAMETLGGAVARLNGQAASAAEMITAKNSASTPA